MDPQVASSSQLVLNAENRQTGAPYAGNLNNLASIDCMAAIGTLLGMKPAPVTDAGVLEIGSGSGANLISLANKYPNSRFTGLENDKERRSESLSLVANLGLKNIEFLEWQHQTALFELEQFDYIIVNGVFSWVDQKLQGSILNLCKNYLAPQGIVFINYNTYPGWHLRGLVRDAVQYHVRSLQDHGDRLKQGANLVAALANSVGALSENIESSADANGIRTYSHMLKEALVNLEQGGSHWLEDMVSTVNQPIYFHEFASLVERFDLQYLGEADFATMHMTNFPEPVQQALLPVAGDQIQLEQYMDFVRNRCFRQTLLCRKNMHLEREVRAENVMTLAVASALSPDQQDLDLTGREPVAFRSQPGGQMGFVSSEPITKIALASLNKIWPSSLGVNELFGQSVRVLGNVEQPELLKQKLASELIEAYKHNLVQFRTSSDSFVTEAGDHPAVSKLCRYQAESADFVTNQLHDSVSVDVFAKNLILALDGKRTRQELVAYLSQRVNDGKLSIYKDGQQLMPDSLEAANFVKAGIDECLQKLAQVALLIS